MSERHDKLLERLHKGIVKTCAYMEQLEPAQWAVVVYAEPYPWSARDLLAHLLSAEEGLLQLVEDVAGGGRGAPDGFDYDAFNADEQKRLAGIPPVQLLTDLSAARQRTIAFVTALAEADLDRTGYHPALGEIRVEDFLTAIYGHQLLHMRDLMAVLE